MVASTRDVMGQILGEQGKYQEAVDELGRADAINERVWGADHPNTAGNLGVRGEVYLRMKAYGAAVADLERALRVFRKSGSAPDYLAEVQFALARALWGQRIDRARALTLAEAARAAYATPPEATAELTEVNRWLAAHRGATARR